MNGEDDPVLETIERDIKATLTALAHSRQLLSQDEVAPLGDVGARLDACSQQIANLTPGRREQVKPLLLALLDEINRTMTLFRNHMQATGSQLASAHQSRAVGAAYRHTQKF